MHQEYFIMNTQIYIKYLNNMNLFTKIKITTIYVLVFENITFKNIKINLNKMQFVICSLPTNKLLQKI